MKNGIKTIQLHFQKVSCLEKSKSLYGIPGNEEVFKC